MLDDVLGGGLQSGDLALVAGPPGVGKTVAALQWARDAALSGERVLFVCYEHDPDTLLLRLLALELGSRAGAEIQARQTIQDLARGASDRRGLEAHLHQSPSGEAALAELRRYADNLVLVGASGARTTVTEINDLIEHGADGEAATAAFIDYLQKVAMVPEPEFEAEKVTRTVEGLKDLALRWEIPVVLLSAVDAAGMTAQRLRLHHLRGSSAIAFEADVVLMLNDKEKAVSKVHLTYDTVRAHSFRNWTVMSVEKNRGGPNLVDLEFEKDFAHFRFDPDGGFVAEQLVSERLDEAAL